MIDMNFDKAVTLVLSFEGVYSNDPDDPGGETVYGISRRNWPQWPGWPLVDAIKKQNPQIVGAVLKVNAGILGMVKQFYYEHFWLVVRAPEVDPRIGLELFDTAVNQGTKAAVSYLQQALNRLNTAGRDYKEIEPDGSFGSETLKAYAAYMGTQNRPGRSLNNNVKVLLKMLNYYQICKYDSICAKNEAQEKYIYGWILNRTEL